MQLICKNNKALNTTSHTLTTKHLQTFTILRGMATIEASVGQTSFVDNDKQELFRLSNCVY